MEDVLCRTDRPEIDEIDHAAVKRAYMIIREFGKADSGQIDPGLLNKYHAWLVSEKWMREREIAMSIIFGEILDDVEYQLPDSNWLAELIENAIIEEYEY